MEKVNQKIKELENKFKFSRVKQVHGEVVSYLNILQEISHVSYWQSYK